MQTAANTTAELSSTAAQAQYAAKAVNARARENLGWSGMSHSSPFKWGYASSHREEYRTKRGWSTFIVYDGAEQALRDLAQNTNDAVLTRFVRKIDSGTTKSLRARISFHRHIADENPRPHVVTDGQKSRVYRAENTLRQNRLATFAEAEAFIQAVVSTDWWQERMGCNDPTKTDAVLVKYLPGNGSATANWFWRIIRLRNSWSWEKSVCLHEMAHLLAPDTEKHGPMFVACHILLVSTFIDDVTGEALRQSYIARGVKIATAATLSELFEKRRTDGKNVDGHSIVVTFDHTPVRRARKP